MTNWILPLMILGAAVTLAWPLSWYMQNVCDPDGKSALMRRWHQWLENVLGRNSSNAPVTWAAYCRSMLVFNYCMFVLNFYVLSFQGFLPINPDGKPGLEPTLAFNTAISFITNTNLQHYSGEVSLSYFSQLSLMWLQFVSAATRIAVLVAVARAMAGSKSMGDFYRDVATASFLVLLPLSATAQAIVTGDEAIWYFLALTLILWFTVLFANFAESVAEARGRAQAASLRSARKDVTANKVAVLEKGSDPDSRNGPPSPKHLLLLPLCGRQSSGARSGISLESLEFATEFGAMIAVSSIIR